MRVHLCGVRGSTPAVGSEFAEVGGNTSCVALAHDDESAPRLVLDAGTGLRAVSALMAGESFHGTILLGHLHWDHTQGLPFFRAADRADAVTRVLIPEQGAPPLELLDRFMSPPAFPVLASELLARGPSIRSTKASTPSKISRCWPARFLTKAAARWAIA